MLEALLKRVIRTGALAVRLPSGEVMTFGEAEDAPLRIAIRDRRTALRLAINPQLALGEAYVDGGLVIERGELWDLLDLIGRNLPQRTGRPPLLTRLLGRLDQMNSRRASRRNVEHHYDLGLDLYRRFLDEDLQYSCAYFQHPDTSLEQAQQAKKRRLAAKLALRPGLRVLDIGCGWGGLAMSLAEQASVRVTGITLSPEQLAAARARAAERGLSDDVEFRLQDYRDMDGPFDRIVSVGMFEHVGRPNYRAYFDSIARLLADDGVAVVHSIGVTSPAGRVQPWIGKYIFPGGYTPALSEVLPAIEQAGLWVTDVEVLRLHYAQTLRAWRERFTARRAEIARDYGERFCRIWEFYLCLSELGFRYRGCMVFQIQLARRVDALPITRDYMSDPVAADGTGGRRRRTPGARLQQRT
ncbi:class I SAM-dependent methyltransferase [Phenylobacterium terrae]|uniref:Class I SAM-dependent methyltransferase n=1 Tax=Phenylobacterium terrae TaxID=2665495 RepID=A0ABW4N8A1_9CAUL